MKKISYVLTLSFLILIISGCTIQTDAQKSFKTKESGATSVKEKKIKEVIKKKRDTTSNLKKEEKWALLFMLEEEKMIRDLSYNFFQKYDEEIFEDIYKAENTHIDPLQEFAQDYNLDDPTSKNGVGEFHNPQIQMIYNDLLEQGNKDKISAYRSLLQALERGVKDLNENIDKTDKDGILFVYRNLKRSSKNHIRALMKIVRGEEESYSPEHLSEAKFNSIKNSSIDSGSWWPF